VIILDQEGKIIESKISEDMENDYHLLWLKFFAFIVSLRFPMAGFDTQLGGLEMTVNLFKEKAVIVKMLDRKHIVTIIVPRTPQSITSAINALSGVAIE
jgi:hypothetical protein